MAKAIHDAVSAGRFALPSWDRELESEKEFFRSIAVAAHGAGCDPVGSVEIAARAGVTRSTVDQWRQRDLGFPVPRWTVGGRPAWDWSDIAAWLTKTGRA